MRSEGSGEGVKRVPTDEEGQSAVAEGLAVGGGQGGDGILREKQRAEHERPGPIWQRTKDVAYGLYALTLILLVFCGLPFAALVIPGQLPGIWPLAAYIAELAA